MSSSIFDDKTIKPDDKMLSEAIGETSEIWDEIKQQLKSQYGDLIEEWKFYGKKSGWILKTLKKKRNLFFFLPVKDYFKITFVFGDKAVAVIEQSDLPEHIKVTLRNARKYAEGRGIQIEVKSSDEIEIIRKLVEIKINN